MNPIDYGGALLRRWWMVLLVGCVGALIAVALPVSHAKTGANSQSSPVSSWKWRTATLVGVLPGVGTGEVTTPLITFFGSESSVAVAAAKHAGLRGNPAELASAASPFGTDLTSAASSSASAATKKATLAPAGQVWLTTVGPTRALSAAFTNAYAAQVGASLKNFVSAHYLSQVQADHQSVTTLQNKLNLLNLNKASAAATSSLQGQINTANAELQVLEASPPAIGYQILRPADASSAMVVAGTSASSSLGQSRKVRVLGGFVLGLLIGAGVALLIELLDKRLRTASRTVETFGFPVVAEVPTPSQANGESVFTGSGHSASPMAEAYRMLRMSVLLEGLAPVVYDEPSVPSSRPDPSAREDNGVAVSQALRTVEGPGDPRQVILVVSGGMERTRPMVVANLAASYAEAEQRVIVISALDLHVDYQAGEQRFASHLVQPSDIQANLEPSSQANVAILPLGRFIGNSGQLVTRAPGVIEAARKVADVIVVEAPPILAYHDGEALTPWADVVLVVGECLATTSDEAQRTGEILRRIGAPVLGVVFTNVEFNANDTRRKVHQTDLKTGRSDRTGYEGPSGPPVESAVIQTKPVPVAQSPSGTPHTRSGNGVPQPVTPNGVPQPVKVNGAHQPVTPNGVPQPVNGNGAHQPVNGNGVPTPVNGNGAHQPVNGNGAPKLVNGNGAPTPVNGNGAHHPANGNGAPTPVNGNGAPTPVNGNGIEDPDASGDLDVVASRMGPSGSHSDS